MDTNTMDRFILQTALGQLDKDLKKQNSKVEKASEKVMNDSWVTQSARRRAMNRVRLNCECEQKDRLEQYFSRTMELIENTYNHTYSK